MALICLNYSVKVKEVFRVSVGPCPGQKVLLQNKMEGHPSLTNKTELELEPCSFYKGW